MSAVDNIGLILAIFLRIKIKQDTVMVDSLDIIHHRSVL